MRSFAPASVLFGESRLNARRKYQDDDVDVNDYRDEHYYVDDTVHVVDDRTGSSGNDAAVRPAKGSLSDWLFGFMYEDEILRGGDDDADDVDLLYSSVLVEPSTNVWNALNASLFLSLTLSTFATAVPVALVATMSEDLVSAAAAAAAADDATTTTTSVFASKATVAAVLGTSFGKFVNGPVGDVFGARRGSTAYSIFLSLSLVLLAFSNSVETATWAFFLVEFSYSVQWPCCVVTLATHYRGSSTGMYEGGIYVTSLAARLGSLIGIPTCSLLLRHVHWRFVAFIGAWASLLASSVTYLYVKDSPNRQDDPQNPIDPTHMPKWFPEHYSHRRRPSLGVLLRMSQIVIRENVLPSMRHILLNGTFWIVALAHTGASMVRTSERVIGTYLYETGNGELTESRSAGLAVFLSIGTVAGLIVAGNMFAVRQERERKWLISKLYVTTIVSCYALALFAIPTLRYAINSPGLITAFQVMAVSVAGFGIAVQFYHIPSLVGATFGCDKGLFSSYTDGVAYGIASVVWRIVGNAVERGNSDGGGWAYGWAAVALLLILAGILMVEFFEHFFCRHRYGASSQETILFA